MANIGEIIVSKQKIQELQNCLAKCDTVWSIYEMDAMTVQELLCQFFGKINECVDVSNTTLELAKWIVTEGLEQEVIKTLNQWKDDGTLANIINVTIFQDLNKKIRDLSTRFDNLEVINVIELGIKGDGTPEDPKVVNDLFTETMINKHLYFPPNHTYNFTKPIKINAKNSKITMAGVMIEDNHEALILDDVQKCRIEVNKITSSTTYSTYSDWNTDKKIIPYTSFTSTGMLFNNVRDCYMEINTIHGQKYGLAFKPTEYNEDMSGRFHPSGTQYNTIVYQMIEACTFPIYAGLQGRDTWVNSNTFVGGSLSGYHGVYFEETGFKGDPFNQNVFRGLGLEYIYKGSIELENTKECLFENFRCDKVKEFYIKTNEKCFNNTFRTTYGVFFEGCVFQGKGNILEGGISAYSDPTNPLGYKAVYLNEGNRAIMGYEMSKHIQNRTEVFQDTQESLGGVFGECYRVVKDAYGKKRVIGAFDKALISSGQTVNLDLGSLYRTIVIDKSNMTVKFTQDAWFTMAEGQEIRFIVKGGVEGTLFQDFGGAPIGALNNKLVAPVNSTMFRIFSINGDWHVYKIGERL